MPQNPLGDRVFKWMVGKMRTKPTIELDIAKVEELAGLGLTKEEIALNLGVSYSTLNRRAKESEELDAAIKRGRTAANIKVAGALMKSIEQGNVTAIIFYLKARAGWMEKQKIEAEVTSQSAASEGLAAVYAAIRNIRNAASNDESDGVVCCGTGGKTPN